MHKYTVNLLNSVYSKKYMIQFLFAISLCLVIHLLILQYFYYLGDDFKIIMNVSRRKSNIDQYPKRSKFILVWNKHNNILKKFGMNNGLVNCSICNCVFTDDKSLLYYHVQYDAIIFNEFSLNSYDRPKRRKKSQFYIFSSQTSSYESPACELYNDNFFNLTHTYRLDSDVLWSYIVVRNVSGEVIAPRASVNWDKSMNAVSREIKSILIQKRKTAMWLGNYDGSDELANEYLRRLQEHLFHYSLKIDAYGKPAAYPNDSDKIITEEYYFYIAFENFFSVDHVTDVVLRGYNSYAVPIVFGGANYSRFLPPGSYINARELHPYNLAFMMYKAVRDPVLYEAYFRWTNLYTIQDNSKSYKSLCNLCESIHSFQADSVIKPAMKQFRRWWNGLVGMKRCLLKG